MYTLGAVTLPGPVSFQRNQIETQTVNLLFGGTTKRNFVNRKEQFVLEFMHLTQAEVNNILSEFNLNAIREFEVDETDFSIGPTSVLIDVEKREYATKGPEYRENMTIVLTEVI